MTLHRLVVLSFFVLISQPIQAQWRLLYRSQDIPQQSMSVPLPDTVNQIAYIESRGTLSKYLIVHYVHSKRRLIPKKDIWGLVDGLGAVWRCYDKELFLVITRSDGWVEYAVERPVRTRLTAMHGAIMYSRTLNSKIKATWSDAMADAPPGFVVPRKIRYR